MFFPISGAHISPIYLVIVGFVIGILGGFFGVGGSFIAGPALRAGRIGLEFRGRHRSRAHRRKIRGGGKTAPRTWERRSCVSGLIMAIGTIAGAEVGRAVDSNVKARGQR